MLENKRITITGDTIVDGEKIATFGAILNMDNLELSMTGRYINKDACKLHRDMVNADRMEFEDQAYALQDMLQAGVQE